MIGIQSVSSPAYGVRFEQRNSFQYQEAKSGQFDALL